GEADKFPFAKNTEEGKSSTRVCDLHLHPDLKEYIKNNRSEWRCDGDKLQRVTISSVSRITDKRPIELTCRMKNDKGEEEKEGKEEENERKEEEIPNDLVMVKEEFPDAALVFMNNRSISPLRTQPVNAPAHFLGESVQEGIK
ncbi:hypothetical protein PFISCL1PPCAC_21775, partial [Pristionchus fissidentatus]